jgi:hypothetical protein
VWRDLRGDGREISHHVFESAFLGEALQTNSFRLGGNALQGLGLVPARADQVPDQQNGCRNQSQ